MASVLAAVSKAAQFAVLQGNCVGDELSDEAQALLEPQRLGAVASTGGVGSSSLRPFPSVDELRRALLPPGSSTCGGDDKQASDDDYAPRRTSDFLPVLITKGKATASQRAFWRACEARRIFEIYSADLIHGMLEYLERRAVELRACGKCDPHDPIVVLEIGAGDGLFTRALRQNQRVSSLLVFKASDINPPRNAPRENMVERMDARRALQRHKPTFVLCVWMPSGVDFSEDVRRCRSCQEYTLLGVRDSSVCGDAWATWGKAAQELIEDYGLPEDAKPPYEEAGWHQKPLPLLSQMTLCRFDTNSSRGGCSQVASFRRGMEEGSSRAARPPRPYHMMSLEELVAFAQTISVR